MAVEQKLEIDGEVTEALPNLLFRVKLENDHELLAHLAGKMRRFRIRVLSGRQGPGRGLSLRPQPRTHRLPLQVGSSAPTAQLIAASAAIGLAATKRSRGNFSSTGAIALWRSTPTVTTVS